MDGASGCETRAAPAGARGIGVGEDKAAAHEFILEVNRGSVEVEQAFWIADDPDAVLLEGLIGVFDSLSQVQDITKTRTSAALDAHAQVYLLGIEFLVFDNGGDFACGGFGQRDHIQGSLPGERTWTIIYVDQGAGTP